MTALFKLLVVFALSLCIVIPSYGGQSKLGPILGNSTIACCSFAPFSIEVENINPDFSIEGIEALFEIRRDGELIYSTVLPGPPGADLNPGETYTFEMEVPMAITLLDALLELRFFMDSDFDLNPDPSKTTTASVAGCGNPVDVAIDLMLSYMEQHYAEFLPVDAPLYFETFEDAIVYFYPELLKPGTEIRNPYGALYATMAAFSYIAVIDWFPRARYEKPVTVLTMDSNTEEVSWSEELWYPVIHPPGNPTGIALYTDPFLKQDKIIRGTQPVAVPPPFPLTGTPVTPASGNGVCALLVSGVDSRNANMNQSFLNDVETARQLLTTNEYGPRLPASAIQVLNGISRDQLIAQLDALKDQYQNVYFFYSGHATKTGQMVLGMNSQDRLSYQELMTKLYDSNAPDLKVIMDCCYSGQLIDIACEDPRIDSRNIEIVTSADANRISGARWYVNESGEKEQHGQFITQLFWQYSNPENDVNRDNKISLMESFSAVKAANQNSITELQDPQKKVQLNATFAQIKPFFRDAVVARYGEDVANQANLRIFPEALGTGIIVTSFDGEYTATIPNLTYFGWIDSKPNSLFGKPVTYAYMDPVSFEVNFENSIQYWPQISQIPSFNPFNRDYLIANNTVIYTTPVPTHIYEQQDPVDPGPRVCALIVTGTDECYLTKKAFHATADMFRTELMHEALGPRLPEQNIRVEKGISADSLRAILASMAGKYDKVYFYYIGHGSKHGRLYFANHPNDFINYSEFLDALANVGATDYSIFVESSSAGIMHREFKVSKRFEYTDIDIFTSSGSNSPANISYHDVDDEITGYGSFGAHFMIPYGDPASNQDENPNVSLKEAFSSMYRSNPEVPGGQLVDLQWPEYGVRRYFIGSGEKPLEHEFRDTDLRIAYSFRSPMALDITADAFLAVSPVKQPSDPNVFGISPVRAWDLSGDFSADPSLRGDLEFTYDEGIDIIDAQEGILGLVSRADTTEEWQAYYPTEYDAGNHTLIARNATGVRQWAIARVVDMSSAVHDPKEKFGITLSPNPVSQGCIVLHTSPDQPIRMQISVISLNGNVCLATEEIDVQGEMDVVLDADNLLPGMYFVRIMADDLVGSIPVIIID